MLQWPRCHTSHVVDPATLANYIRCSLTTKNECFDDGDGNCGG